MAMSKKHEKPSESLIHKTTHLMHEGMDGHAFGEFEMPPALGDARWTDELILSTWHMSATGKVPDHLNYKTGKSDGGFDRLDFKFLGEDEWLDHNGEIDTSIPLNRRGDERAKLSPPIPIYGGGRAREVLYDNVKVKRVF